MRDPLPLSAQLSAAFVALTIEADNAAEQRLSHTTTAFGPAGEGGAVWLASLAMWFNCVGPLADAGGELTAAALQARADDDQPRRDATLGLHHDRRHRTPAAPAALETVVGDGTRSGSPLFAGLEPAADGWRARVTPPRLLPWYPLVLHGGGYPDGS